MKRLIKTSGIILSLALVLQCCFIFTGTTAMAEQENLVLNPGFEEINDNAANEWGLWPGWNEKDFISTDFAHTGSNAIKVNPDDKNYALFSRAYNPSDFNTSASVIISAWVYYENLTGGFYFAYERKAEDKNVAGFSGELITGNSDGWKQISYEIPVTTKNIEESIIKFEISPGSGTLYIDDVCMSINPVQNIMDNAGFEKGDRDKNWGCYNADTFITTDLADVHTGNKAIKITQGTSEYAIWSSTYGSDRINPEVAMTFSIWAKYEGITDDGFRIIAESENGETYATSSYTGSSDGWKLITFDTPVFRGRTGVCFKISVFAGTGTVCFDDASISKAERQNYIKNSGFEFGNGNFGFYNDTHNQYITTESYRGNCAAKVVLNDAYNFSIWSDDYSAMLNPCGEFTASVMLRYENMTSGEIYMHFNRGNGTQINSQHYYFNGTSDGWSEYSFNIPSDINADIAQMQIEFSKGSGTVWIDDICLSERTDSYVNFAANSNTSFESTSIENSVVTAREWGMYPQWSENACVTSEIAHGNNNSVRVNLSETQKYAMFYTFNDYSKFDPEQALVVSAWINVPSDKPVNGILYLGCERTNYNLIGERLENYTTDGQWVRVTRVLPESGAQASQLILKAELSVGTGTMYLDDFEVYPLTKAELSADNTSVTFTSENVRIGDPIAITSSDVVGKVKHIYQDGIKISAADGSAQGVQSAENVVISVTYDEPLMGDANDDGVVNLFDIVRLKKYLSDNSSVKICSLAADVAQGDGLNSMDLSALRRALLVS